ncbi:MAG: IGHMBP2 family helicase [Kofleriaceae bacterium]|nr:IGHMBP2 family helicase [Kofleriaceae bacterium]
MAPASEWIDSVAAAWRAERQAARAKVAMERSGRTLVERVALGIALAHLRIVDEQSAPGDRVRVRVSVPEQIDLDNLRLAPGEPIRLWAEHPDEEDAIRGVFERREEQSLWLMLDRPVDELDRDYALDPEAPELTFERGDRALDKARSALANSDLARLREVASLARPAKLLAPITWKPLDEELDEVQREAVDLGLRSGDIALIWGPPGTGKTRTLVEVIRQRVARGERVLCAAPSNTAVDNLGIRLAGEGVRAVRLGHPARVSPALAALTIDAQVEEDGAFDLAREWRDRARAIRKQAQSTSIGKGTREDVARQRAEIRALWSEARSLDRDAAREVQNAERAIIARAQVVLATCVGCDHPMLGDTQFDCVVVDEVTQAPDPLLFIALGRAKVAVLAGDPQQLGPVIIGGPAVEAVLGSTVFERLIASGAPSVMLEQQHRMHAQIMTFPSRATYDGKLRASPQVAAHTLEDLGVVADAARSRPLWLVDTAGKDWLEERTDFEPAGSLNNLPSFSFDPSTFNSGNAERVAAEARRLLSRGVAPTDLAIIAAYSAQARRLRDLLRLERAAGVEVGTVDGFQGREKEVVIVDLVRSNDSGEIGFLANTRRMNVALTRAKRFLLVVADSATLGDHPYYAQFIQYVDEIDGHGSAWSDDAEPLK